MTVSARPIECLLIDCDDCLYHSPEMQAACAEKIRQYMVERLGVPADEVHELCTEYYLNYGTTLAGLVANGWTIDYDDWHAFVHHTLDYEVYLKPDPALRQLLLSIKLPKFVFSNADKWHCERVLSILGIADCFNGLVCFESVQEVAAAKGWVRHGRPVVAKPNRQAYMIALEAAGSPAPAATLWLDDSTRNITAGHRLGMCCVLVGRTGVDTPADYQIERLTELRDAVPWLWEQQQQSEQQQHDRQEQQGAQQQQGLGKAEPLAALVSSPRGEAITAFSV